MKIVVWKLIAHHQLDCRLPMIQLAKDNDWIAIGWDVGSLAQYETPEDIQEEVRERFRGQGPPGEKSTAGIQLCNFRGGEGAFHPGVKADPHDLVMQCGDLVILKTDDKHGGWPQSVVMRVTGAYEYVPSPCSGDWQWLYPHQRKAEPTGYDPKNLKNLWNEIVGGPAPCQDKRGNALLRGRFPVEWQDGQIRRVTAG